jgi:hypothetical protein
MKMIFSRKGFDSASGGKPSPIFPDGRMVSLPIPDRDSPILYRDIRWQEFNLGSLVSDLTDGDIPASHHAHLDPDLTADSLPRHCAWRPIFGQTGAAQSHLRNCGVQSGDVFLFFGLFRHAVIRAGRAVWDRASPRQHILWGWMQIGDVLAVDRCDRSKYEWAEYHPHFHRAVEPNNTLYVARKTLYIPGMTTKLAGAGTFSHLSDVLQLTAKSAASPSLWELPYWFYPRNGAFPLTYHSNAARWKRTKNGSQLNAVGRGQEFVLDTGTYPEAIGWLSSLMAIA